jgi:hypothetical protein
VIVGLGSLPGSETVYVYVFVSPSFALSGPERTTVGTTFATVTVFVSALEGALSESFTWTETTELAGPSGNVQSKLPAPVELLKVAGALRLPFAPQLAVTRLNVSCPGSLVVNV